MRVLFVGLGAVGQRHVRNLRRLVGPDLELSAYRVLGRQRVIDDALQVEAESGLEEAYGIRPTRDLEAALDCRPDAVFVTNPSGQHMEIALQAARAGCALFIEKPLATVDDRIEELARIVDERRLVACVGYPFRFHPCLGQLQALLAEGRPGRVVAVRAIAGEYLPGWHPYEDYRESYASRADLGGGVLLTQSHEFDYLFACFGLPRRVYALGGRLGRLEIDVEDTASVLLDYATADQRFVAHVQLDYLQRPAQRSCEVLGEEGRLLLDLGRATLDDVRVDGSVHRFEASGFVRNDMFLAELAHFLACLEGRERPRVGIRDGWASVRMALAARRSLATGEAVVP